jgi:hypothetical protein
MAAPTSTESSARKQPWIMNAFAMTAPGHLAPGDINIFGLVQQDLG